MRSSIGFKIHLVGIPERTAILLQGRNFRFRQFALGTRASAQGSYLRLAVATEPAPMWSHGFCFLEIIDFPVHSNITYDFASCSPLSDSAPHMLCRGNFILGD